MEKERKRLITDQKINELKKYHLELVIFLTIIKIANEAKIFLEMT